MNNIRIFLLGIFLMPLLITCSKDKDEDACPVSEKDSLIISFNATADGLPLEFAKEFNDPLNRKMRVELFKTYVSNVYLNNGSNKTKVVDAELIIFEDGGELDPGDVKQKIFITAPIGDYTGISLGIGLNPTQNNMDPNSFDSDHPLSSQQGTYWSAWTKYKFLMLEGRADGHADGQLTDIYGYHTGFDFCYREKTFEKQIKIESGITNTIDFTIEINNLFFGNDTLDFVSEPSWHGDTILVDRAIKLSDNAIDALKLN